MLGPETISVSQINLYLTCSLKYRFQYIDRLPRPTIPENMVFGSAFHAAIEWLHKERKRGRTPPLDEVLRVFEADWNAQLVGQLPVEDEAHLILKGKELLARYYHEAPEKIRESELYFQLPLVNPATGEVLDLPLRGVIDLVQEDDTIDEFKTSKRKFPLDALPDNIQLTAYSYAFEKLFGRPPKELRLINFLKTKNPDIDVQVTWREARDYERLFYLGKEVVKGVRNGIFIPHRGCWMCSDCEYQEDCREWTGNEDGDAGDPTRRDVP
jgi:putative RecB family exonuclease